MPVPVWGSVLNRGRRHAGRNCHPALTKFYGPRAVVNHLDFRIPQGTVYGFLGRNGAGKTTTLKMLLGMVHPDCGHAELLGEESARLRPETRA